MNVYDFTVSTGKTTLQGHVNAETDSDAMAQAEKFAGMLSETRASVTGLMKRPTPLADFGPIRRMATPVRHRDGNGLGR